MPGASSVLLIRALSLHLATETSVHAGKGSNFTVSYKQLGTVHTHTYDTVAICTGFCQIPRMIQAEVILQIFHLLSCLYSLS